MTPMDLFWLFFMITALQPVLKQKFLEASRQRLIEKIERKHNSRVIVLIHRQETMSLLGFPLLRYIDINDSEEIIRAIHLTDSSVPLDIVVHTPGGLVLAALQIARAIHQHPAKTRVFVPFYAMSGGTLIAMAADEIVMCKHAVLGPVDPQLGQYPAASILKVVSQKPLSEIDDNTLIMADQGEKAISQLKTSVTELLSDKMEPAKAKELADIMTQGTWTHDYPITCERAQKLGLNVNCDMPEDVMNLMGLFPQPVRRMPSVEYLPEPRKATPAKSVING
ncbi:MAG: hypothetical protein D6719_01390 [Candidatus Dadabacteria bacterium]|nr:MAG: hypothetical protein D6719_01390 [Candidatus Dadabacteria bacterium]